MEWSALQRAPEGLAKGVLDKNLSYNQNREAWKDILITYHTCHEMENLHTRKCQHPDLWQRTFMAHGLYEKERIGACLQVHLDIRMGIVLYGAVLRRKKKIK